MNKKLYLPITIFFTAMISAQAPAIQWQKSLGGSSVETANSIQQTSDGGYIVAGSSFSSNNGDVADNHGDADYSVVKLAPDNLHTNDISAKNTISIKNPVKEKFNIQSRNHQLVAVV